MEAIQSVIDLFEGQHLNSSDFEFPFTNAASASIVFTDVRVGNNLTLSEEELTTDLVKVQQKNNLSKDETTPALKKLWYNGDAETKGILAGKTVTM